MAVSNKEVVHAFQIFEKRLVLLYILRAIYKKMMQIQKYYLSKSQFFFMTYY